MLEALNPVPFVVDVFEGSGAHHGYAIVKGLIRCERGRLVIECRRYGVLGEPKGELSDVHVPLVDVVHLRIDRRWYRRTGRLELRVRTHRTLEELPASENGALRVEIARADLDDAERFCLEVSQAIIRQRTERLTEQIERGELD